MRLPPSFGPTTSIFKKELRSEVRTRYALNALLMFVVTTISVILFSLGNETVSAEVLAGVLWVIIFFSTMSGLSRTFISEEERGTVMTLQLVARPHPIFFGKLLFNVSLLSALNVFTVSLYFIVIPAFMPQNLGVFLLTLLLGTFGLASASTLIAAIIAKANVKGTLYPVLSFPILLPLLLSVINATKLSLENAPMIEVFDYLKMLVTYIIVMVAISYILFPLIWKE